MNLNFAQKIATPEYSDSDFMRTDNGIRVFIAIGDARSPVTSTDLLQCETLRGFSEVHISEGLAWAKDQGLIELTGGNRFQLSEKGRGEHISQTAQRWCPR